MVWRLAIGIILGIYNSHLQARIAARFYRVATDIRNDFGVDCMGCAKTHPLLLFCRSEYRFRSCKCLGEASGRSRASYPCGD
jgi:hypothetical protein